MFLIFLLHQATLQVVDDSNNDILGSFTIQNNSGGIQILSTAPADGNSITAGNSQEVTLSNIFITPDVSTVIISSTLNAEMDFSADIQSFIFDLEPAVTFSPTVSISLSNLVQVHFLILVLLFLRILMSLIYHLVLLFLMEVLLRYLR